MLRSESLVNSLQRALLSVDSPAARKVLQGAAAGSARDQLVEEVIVQTLSRIGKGWENGTVALSQLYMSGRILEELVDEIFPPSAHRKEGQPKTAIAVLLDYHMLGKRLVHSALRAAGFQLTDYGRMDIEDLIERVKRDGIQVLLISTLMLSSALRAGEIKPRLNGSGHPLKLVVGGAPFRLDEDLWKEVGADAMGRNAADAITAMTDIMKELS